MLLIVLLNIFFEIRNINLYIKYKRILEYLNKHLSKKVPMSFTCSSFTVLCTKLNKQDTVVWGGMSIC